MHIFTLPDELLLDIASHICFVRAFGHAPGINSTHQDSNQQCLDTLRSLCATSKRLRSICEPRLYTTLIVEPGRPPHRLARYLRTIFTRPVLRQHLKRVYAAALNTYGKDAAFVPEKVIYSDDWVINEWSSFRWLPFRALATREAKRIWAGSGQLRTMAWISNLVVSPEQPLLALVLGMACKTLEDVTITSFDEDGPCLDAVLGLHNRTPELVRACSLSFPRLQRLDLAVACINRDRVYFHCAPQRLPSLTFLQLWGSAEIDHEINAGSSPVTTLNMLQRSGGGLPPTALQRLPSIEVLAFEWVTFEIPENWNFGNMHMLLSNQKHSLQSLTLGAINYKVHTEIDPFQPFRHLGSFRDFACLRVLKIAVFFLLGAPFGIMFLVDRKRGFWWTNERLSVRISELLPASLEHFEITNDVGLGEHALVLRELADDCSRLPLLKFVHLDRCPGPFDYLATKFAVHGVCLTTHWDDDSPVSHPELITY